MVPSRAMATDDPISRILRDDPTYPRAAYEFVKDALAHTVGERAAAAGESTPHHVTGQELARGIRSLALEQFGPLARTVLESWNVHSTADFGRIVYRLIEVQELGRSDDDDIADFDDVYQFDEAFGDDLGDPRVEPPPPEED